METVEVGDNVYVRDPQKFVVDCCSIIGDITGIFQTPAGKYGVVKAYVAKIGSGYPALLSFPVNILALRIGTPISKISTQLGTPGYSEWCRISESWGY
jgi:hypothetical protein